MEWIVKIKEYEWWDGMLDKWIKKYIIEIEYKIEINRISVIKM